MRSSYLSSQSVRTELNKFQVLHARLLAEIPGIDEETLADTLE